MKKLFTILAGLSILGTSHALADWTIYYTNPNNWAAPYVWPWNGNKGGEDFTGTKWPGVQMTKVGNYWTYTYKGELKPTNVIISNNGSDNDRCEGTIDTNSDYYYTYSTNKDLMTYTPYVNLKAANVNNWGDIGIQPNANGLCTWENVALGDGAFQFKVWNGKGAKDDQYYVSSENGTITADSEFYSLINKESVMTVTNSYPGSAYNITYNFLNNTVSLEQVFPENLYIIGYIEGTSFDYSGTVPMVNNGKGVYTLENVILTKPSDANNSYFSFCANQGNSWAAIEPRFGATDTDVPFIFDVVGESATEDLSAGKGDATKSFEVTPGFYNIAVNLSAMKVTLTQNLAVPSPQFNPDYNTVQSGEIEGYNITMTTIRNEVQLFIDVPEGTTPFYKLEQSGTVDQSSDGGYELMSLALDVPVEYSEVPFDSAFSNKYAVVLKTGTTGTISLLFAKEVNGETVTSAPVKYTYSVNSGTPTAVEEIEGAEGAEAVYYNLQGTRVYNPERGIFIKVTNGKTQKVIL